MYGVLPILLFVFAHVVARAGNASVVGFDPAKKIAAWVPFAWAAFICFGLTLRALMTGLGTGLSAGRSRPRRYAATIKRDPRAADAGTMPRRLAPDPPPSDAIARVARELARLDPWTFWTVPRDDHLVVTGTTGVFLVVPEVAEGHLEVDGRRVLVGGRALKLRPLRAAAKQLGALLSGGSVFISPEPVLCLTRAVAGGPRTVRGVRVVTVEGLAADVARREKVLAPTRAQRAARLLGMTIAGDDKRNITVVRPSARG